MRNETEPKWQITDTWGIGLDPLNWRLYQRNFVLVKKNTNESGFTDWKVTGYFPTLDLLLKGIIENIMLTESSQPTFKAHLEQALQDAQKAVDAIRLIMIEVGIGLNTYPPAYAKFTEEKSE
mgnify:FL=1